MNNKVVIIIKKERRGKTMEKKFWKSKTIWGFGLFTLTLIGRSLGWIPDNVVIQIITYLEAMLGIYGMRSAL